MNRSLRAARRILPLALFALAGCGDDDGYYQYYDAAHPPAIALGEPIEAPPNTWTWVPFDDAFCGDGSPTGLAINPNDRSPNLVIFLMGGGACWDYKSCYESDRATYVGTGFTESDMPFLTLASTVVGLVNRGDGKNPFRDYSVAALPYCTGDAFTGSRVVDYDGHPTHHVGHSNVLAYLRRLVPTFENANRVIVVGVSAGGIGAGINWWHVKKAFGDVRVDMIDDSGPPMPAPYLKESLEQTWRTTWGLDDALPPDCAACRDDFDAIVPYLGATMPDARGALLDFTHDAVLSDFMQTTPDEFGQGLNKLADDGVEGQDNLRYFFAEGSDHVLMPHPDLEQNGVLVWDWLAAMESDDPSWQSVRP